MACGSYVLPRSRWNRKEFTLRNDWLMTGSFVERREKRSALFNEVSTCEDYTPSTIK